MAYETGTSTGPDDLLDKLRVWLLANGWSVNLWDDDDSMYTAWSGLVGTGKRLHVQKTAGDGTVMYFNLRSVNRGVIFEDYYNDSSIESYGKYRAEVTGLGLNGSTGYDGGNAWDKQPGGTLNDANKSWGVCMTGLSLTAIPAYHFWQDGDTVVICVEYTSGKFQWLSFGCLEKQGVYTGGQFFTGSLSTYVPSQLLFDTGTDYPFISFLSCRESRANGAVYLNCDGTAGWRVSGKEAHWSSGLYNYVRFPSFNPSTNSPTYANWQSLLSFWTTRSPNTFNNIPTFSPLYITCLRADGRYSLLGWPAGIRFVVPRDFDPSAEIVYGSDHWQVFPAHSKADAQGLKVGFALLKNQ